MRFNGSKKLANYFKVGVALFGVLGSMVFSNVSVAMAEDIIHTHIWATKYDDSKHWEYCTVCKKTQESKTHVMVDHWEFGYESCHKSNGNNFNTKICECGYNYVYRKPHTEEANWNNTGIRMVHFKRCSVCKDWTRSAKCEDAQGTLGCTNPGTCTTCGYVATKDAHYITQGGKCRDCKKQFFSPSDYTVDYASDYKTATVKFTFTPTDSSVDLTGTMGAYCGNPNYTTNEWKYSKASNGAVTYSGVYTFDASKQRKAALNFLDRTGALKINGTSVYTDATIYKFEIWQDHKKPVVTEVKQKDQTLHNTWATIKELTINGTEDLSKIVTISIVDPATNDVIVDKAKTAVKDGKYSYKCTPPLEGPVEGRKYRLIVVDEIGNTTEKDFMIYKTDCRAPLLRSEKEYTEWSQTKNLEFKLTDYGSGSAQTSLINQTSYKATSFVNDSYVAKYTFAEENYGVTEYKMYVRDGLGNAALETIKVGKVDNTKPTITDIKDEKSYEMAAAVVGGAEPSKDPIGVIIDISANDMNTTLNAEGSGVAGYAITKSKDIPAADAWQEANVFELKEAGKYYVWVKDKAGNMANLRVLNVKDDFSVEYDPEEIVVDDEEPTIPEEGEDDKVIEDDKDKNEGEDDKTPGTGDNSYIMFAAGFMLLSGVVAVAIRRRRNLV